MVNKSLLSTLGETRPVLIAGATASGKSALALQIAEQLGGVIVNADACRSTAVGAFSPRALRPRKKAAHRTLYMGMWPITKAILWAIGCAT